VIAEGILASFRKSDSKLARAPEPEPASADEGYELVRITERRMEAVAQGVLAFDVTVAGVIVYSDGSGVFRLSAESPSVPERITDLASVEQLVIC
jgi:hypothetical protein